MSRERAGGSAVSGGPARDPAAQPERTRLAWRRTVLASAVVAVLAARRAAHGAGDAVWWAAVSAAAWVALAASAARRSRELAVPRPVPLGVSGALSAVICTLAVPICGVVVLLW
ncbi:DUF202 domain-containing protein [Streptomyces sp. URMC 125]|uniref:DUF202 domain-containing protein n=1 Tax=Streptomyces sp. URMC 125 TaxID=3423419 RepID=UPI003F1A0CDD